MSRHAFAAAARAAPAALVARLRPADGALGELLAVAGREARWEVSDVRGMQLVGACCAVGVAFQFKVNAPLPAICASCAIAAWAGAAVPIVWLRRGAATRLASVRDALPDAIEFLRACVAGGMPLRRALGAVSEHCGEPVASEFARVACEAAIGMPLAEALERLERRNPITEIGALAVAARHAERYGAPLAQTLGQIADDARRERARRIAERAAAAGPQIQLVVAVLLVPAALLELAALLIGAVLRGDLQLL